MPMDRNTQRLNTIADKTAKGLRRSHSAYCLCCEKIVELLTFEEAADCFNTDERDIEFLSKRLMLHRIHNRKGTVMICSLSLFECFETRATRLLDDSFLNTAAS
jgi:hypothetical protein